MRAFHRVYANIESIRHAGLPIRLTITPSTHMGSDVATLVNMVEDLGIKYGVNSSLTRPRSNTGREKCDISIDEYLDIYRLLSSINHKDITPLSWSEVPNANRGGTHRFGTRCGAGRSAFGIRYDGAMCPCLSLAEVTAWPLEVGFEEAWREINEAAESYRIPLECGDCIYQQVCLSCVAVHKSAPKTGHCDPVVCERMRRLVKEGFVTLNNN